MTPVVEPQTNGQKGHPVTTPDPRTAYRLLADNVQLVIQGKPEVVRLAVVALFAEGHLLLEDVPGLGKTSLARASPAASAGTWNRIQFTPDLLPGDITGVMVYHQGSSGVRVPSRRRCSPTSCSPTRSTAARRRPSRRCSR